MQSREVLPSLLVTREVTEHANVYHTLTDLLNVYISLRMLSWESHSRCRSSPTRTYTVLLPPHAFCFLYCCCHNRQHFEDDCCPRQVPSTLHLLASVPACLHCYLGIEALALSCLLYVSQGPTDVCKYIRVMLGMSLRGGDRCL